MSRPEHILPPELFYNERESHKYTQNSRILEIQQQLTERAYELLGIDNDNDGQKFLLDLGCGSGISGSTLTEYGHHWVGLDISSAMLSIANELDEEEEERRFDLMLQDLGQGLSFRPGSFDGAISISVLQWLCNADKTCHNPYTRIQRFFSSLLSCLARGARAVFQFYPENAIQIEMLTNSALKCGFGGGVVVDFPESKKAKKYFLVLCSGFTSVTLPLARGVDGEYLEDEDDSKKVITLLKNKMASKKRKGKGQKDKEWILRKKELARVRGKENVPHDSKYTGRKRKARF